MHELKVKLTDSTERLYRGRAGELWRLRVKLLQAQRLDPTSVIVEQLSTERVEIRASMILRVGRVEDPSARE